MQIYKYTFQMKTTKQRHVTDCHPSDWYWETVEGQKHVSIKILVSHPEHRIHSVQEEIAKDIFEEHYEDSENIELLSWKAEILSYIRAEDLG